MTVHPIEHELGRFFVESQSGREPHTVDLQYLEEPWNKPRPFCGCEESFCKGHICRHIFAAVNHELERLKPVKEAWFTFGQDHVHSVNGFTFDKDVVVHILADDPRKVMVDTFGLKWGFEYDKLPDMSYYPRGIYALEL